MTVSAAAPAVATVQDEGGSPLTVLVAAAYPAVRAGFVALLARDPGLRPVERGPTVDGPWADGPGGGDPLPTVVVVDLGSMPDAAVDDLEERYSGVPLVFVGGNPASDGPGLEAGPVAYLAPDADGPTLIAAVRGVSLGLTVIDPAVAGAAGVHAHRRAGIAPPPGAGTPGDDLTAREREVLALVADGLPNKAIARELRISEHTVKFHVGSLLGKLGAGSRTEAVTLATRRGILTV